MEGAEEVELSSKEIGKYGRQLILPEWGVRGQRLLKGSSVLIVGMGGLGSPAALYLAAAGVGHLGLVDDDVVEISNLQRQVIHSEHAQGTRKVDSAKFSINKLNSEVKCTTYHLHLSKENAMDLVKSYDIILDCTDNVATRYLLNDVGVLLDKPVVSGSALRFEGQLTVYHYDDGPCYRCLFPEPPPQGTVTNCSDGGVIGPVPGMIGTMQAMEALKIASRTGAVLSGRMVLYDALHGTFRTIKLRPRQQNCVVCGATPSVTCLQDYETWCCTCGPGINILAMEDRISCSDYRNVLDEGLNHLLIDVREEGEFDICHFKDAVNIPLKILQKNPKESIQHVMQHLSSISANTVKSCGPLITAESCHPLEDTRHHSPVQNTVESAKLHTEHCVLIPIYVCCRRGNDSQVAVLALRAQLEELSREGENTSMTVPIKDIIGGLTEWTNSVDPTFPKY